jgi:hypothetical protein
MKQHFNSTALVFFIVGILLGNNVLAQNVSKEQEESMTQTVKELLQRYSQLGSFTQDGKTISQEYVQAFASLFKNPTGSLVINDINPRQRKGEVVPISNYISFVKNNYPSGLEIMLDADKLAVVSIVSSMESSNTFELTAKIDKELFGLTGMNILHNFKGELFFRFEVSLVTSGANKATIIQISDFTRLARDEANNRIRGLHVGIIGEPSRTNISSRSFDNQSAWGKTPGQGLNFGVSASWFFNRSFGVSLGVNSTHYQSNLMLNTFSGQANFQLTDLDQDAYFPVYEISDLTEISTLDYIEVPVTLNFRIGKPKIGLYLDMGAVYSYSISAKYQVEGLVKRAGYYPDLDLVIDDVPEYGFETVVLDEAGSWQVSRSNLGVISRLGINIPITRFSNLRVGGIMVMGLNDILYNKPKHTEDFISTTGIIPKSTRLLRTGIEIGVSIKVL